MVRSINRSRDKIHKAKRRIGRVEQTLGRWVRPVLERLSFWRQVPLTLAPTCRRVWPHLELLEDRCLLSASITDLGTVGVDGINDAGQVIGALSTSLPNHDSHAFLYSNGVMTDLGALGEDDPANYESDSEPTGINDAGQVVGSSQTHSIDVETGFAGSRAHAFLYSNGEMTDLGTLGVDNSHSDDVTSAHSINNAGQVVGVSITASGEEHAFLYSNGVMTDLGALYGQSSGADDINDAGQVVGENSTASGEHTFLYSNGVMTDLGTLGGNYTVPGSRNSINDAGQVVGWSDTASGEEHAFLYSNGVMTDLGTLGGVARADALNSTPFFAVS